MELSAIRAKVAAAVAHEQRTGAMRQTLTQSMQAMGAYDANTVEQIVGMVRAYVEQVPAALEAVEAAGKQANVADELKPILDHAERAFVSAQGGIPDESGLMGLTDNAYLMFQLFARVQSEELSPEEIQVHQAIRNLLGEQLAGQVDAVVQAVVALPEVQHALQRLAATGTPAAAAGSSPAQAPAATGAPASGGTAGRPSVVAVRTAPVGTRAPQAQVGATADFPGALDTAFGLGGLAEASMQKGKARSMAIQGDGKIVVAGESSSDSGATSITIARYDPNGALDTTFGGTGCVRLDMGAKGKAQNGSAAAVVVQRDGKIVVAGVTESPPDEVGAKPDQWVLARLTAEGKLDASFAQGGWLQLRLGARAKANALALQDDGKLVVAGSVFNLDENYDRRNYLAIARVLPDGRPDLAFGQAGIAGVEGPEEVFAVALERDGKIVAVGTTSVGVLSTKITLVRTAPNGALDPAFGDGGRLTIDFGGGDNKLHGLVVQPDGKLVLTGQVQEGNSYQYALTRLNSNGSFDAAFGNGGVIRGRFPMSEKGEASGGMCWTQAVALQPDGKVLVAGAVTLRSETKGYVENMPYIVSDRTFAVARFTAGGELDGTFGDGGVVHTDFGEGIDEAYAVALQADNKIVVAGASSRGIALARYLNPAPTEASSKLAPQAEAENTSGKLDPAFNEQGAVVTDFGEGSAVGRAVCVQPDGKILVAGDVDTGQGTTPIDFALARYNADGTPDATFGTNGRALIDITGTDDLAHAVALQPDGKIIVAGEARDQASDSLDFALLRLDALGNLDASFNETGLVLTDFWGGSDDRAYAVAVQPDGKIVAAGYTTFTDGEAAGKPRKRKPTQIECFALARYLPDGRPDEEFGAKGRVVTPFPSHFARARSLCLQPDGKILAAGLVNSGAGETPYNFVVVRYQANGALDESFGIGGIAGIDVPGTDDTAHAVALQSDGKIVVAGDAEDEATGGLHFLVVRLDANGKLDASFNGTGGALADGFSGSVRAVAIQADQKIIVAGYVTQSHDAEQESVDQLAVARYTEDGSFDTGFGRGGVALVDLGGRSDKAHALALQADGKIVAAGTTATGDAATFAVVRLQA